MRTRIMQMAGCALAIALLAPPDPSQAQDAAPPPETEPRPVPRPESLEGFISEGELDELVAPVALYPDSVLTQILVASTLPLEVVKADRFLTENAGLGDKERADAAALEEWDPSVQMLAGGFPTVIRRMAADIDWTEQLGDAVLAQTDDVLEAVQRMRARAAALGNLESNEAQTVETEGDTISIAPADPEVVYVPVYDPAMAFTTTAPAPPVVVSDPGMWNDDLLVGGIIGFGSALLIDEIFDDDDDWDDYWRGPPSIDWDDGDFYPRGGINVEGDVNIDRDRTRIVDRDGERIGDRGDDWQRGEGAWRPSDDQRQAARDKLAARELPGGGAAAAVGAGGALLSQRSGGGGAGGDARARLERAQAARPAGERRADSISALQPRADSAQRVHRAADRGDISVNRGSRPQAGSHDRQRSASRPERARQPNARAPSRSSAFKQHSGGARSAQASRRGGGHSRGGGGRGGGRRR